MQIGMIGLGRMGGNLVRRLTKAGHTCVVNDRDPAAIKALADTGAVGVPDIHALVGHLAKPRTIWIMLPAGEMTETTIGQLAPLLTAGDTIIDGGNTFYKDDIARAKSLMANGIHYIDCGTSGGVWGLERGYCLMIGGERKAVERLDPIFAALAPGEGSVAQTPGRTSRDERVECGYLHCGPAGAGHFVKMVHNGIEYGLMQAYAEGFDILRGAGNERRAAGERYDFDLPDIAEVWRRGSVIGSWLLDLTASALAEDPNLSTYSGMVEDSGEGRWTVNTAIDEAVPAPVLTAALYARFRSREKANFGDKLLSAMRKKFGGHVENNAGPR
ncbi:MAG: decarboxylating 6-phosphogluconate dehydrogenase [Pseudolabrys sp.]|nr:decarboxylating 6-phosphogluconate dehydrogenase [Pseudolabrys sp.]